MITFSREGTKVRIVVNSGVLGYSFNFYHETNQDYLAKLLAEAYQDHMKKTLECERRIAYNQGWKDAKAKVKKETWFSGLW